MSYSKKTNHSICHIFNGSVSNRQVAAFLTGAENLEAKLVTLCCSEPPEGFAKWSLRLLADKMVELKYIDYISHVTVSQVLKKTNLSLGK